MRNFSDLVFFPSKLPGASFAKIIFENGYGLYVFKRNDASLYSALIINSTEDGEFEITKTSKRNAYIADNLTESGVSRLMKDVQEI